MPVACLVFNAYTDEPSSHTIKFYTDYFQHYIIYVFQREKFSTKADFYATYISCMELSKIVHSLINTYHYTIVGVYYSHTSLICNRFCS